MDIPRFILDGGFDWSRKGYSYLLTSQELNITEKKDINKNPWIEILKIVEKAKTGDFSHVSNLSRYITIDNEFNTAPVSLMLIGDMGTKDDLSLLVKIMRDSHEGFVAYACEAARNAGSLWLVPHMIEAWKKSESIFAHEMIGFAIADLLESVNIMDEVGPLSDLAGCFTQVFKERAASRQINNVLPDLVNEEADDKFVNLAMSRYRKISDEVLDDDVAVWSASPIGPFEFAELFLSLISNPSYSRVQDPLTIKYRHKFEAMTGIDCSEFYRDGRFQQIAAVGVLERFLDNESKANYEVGKRYFFGHQIN